MATIRKEDGSGVAKPFVAPGGEYAEKRGLDMIAETWCGMNVIQKWTVLVGFSNAFPSISIILTEVSQMLNTGKM